jgi:hypothetical protein
MMERFGSPPSRIMVGDEKLSGSGAIGTTRRSIVGGPWHRSRQGSTAY